MSGCRKLIDQRQNKHDDAYRHGNNRIRVKPRHDRSGFHRKPVHIMYRHGLSQPAKHQNTFMNSVNIPQDCTRFRHRVNLCAGNILSILPVQFSHETFIIGFSVLPRIDECRHCQVRDGGNPDPQVGIFFTQRRSCTLPALSTQRLRHGRIHLGFKNALQIFIQVIVSAGTVHVNVQRNGRQKDAAAAEAEKNDAHQFPDTALQHLLPYAFFHHPFSFSIL